VNASENPAPRRHPAHTALVVLVALQAVGLAAATAFLVFELLTERPASFASALALTVLAAIAAVGLGFVARGLLQGMAWSRGATVVAQILQIAVAVGSFQGGELARPDIGWLLLAPALVALGLLFSKPVVAATARRDEA